MKNIALTAFAAIAVGGSAIIFGGTIGIAGLLLAGSGGAFAKFAALGVGGAIGFGIAAGISQIKLGDKTLAGHIL